MFPVSNKEHLNVGKPLINYKWAIGHLSHMGFWTNVSKRDDLNEEFIRMFQDSLNWWNLSSNTFLPVTEDFIDEFKDKIKWKLLSRQPLQEPFIEKYKDYVDWGAISFKKYLSDQFIEKYANRINWDVLCKYRQVSEEFIEKFQGYVNWNVISNCQKLSPEFIKKHLNKLNIFDLIYNYKVPYDCRQKLRKICKQQMKKNV